MRSSGAPLPARRAAPRHTRREGNAAAARLTVFAAGHKHEIKDARPKLRAVEIGDYVRGRAGERASDVAAAPRPQETAPDFTDQLRKLAERRDAGVLTPEEFDAKKTELLSRM